jgi:hypothetical protein
MQYVPKQPEFRQKQTSQRNNNSGAKHPHSKAPRSRYVQYKPKFTQDCCEEYQPKQTIEKDSTCSSFPSDSSNSNSSVEREQRQSMGVRGDKQARDHILDTDSFEGGEEEISQNSQNKKFKSCIVDHQD